MMVGTAIYYSSSSYVIYHNIIVQAPVQQLITFAPQSLLNDASLKITMFIFIRSDNDIFKIISSTL